MAIRETFSEEVGFRMRFLYNRNLKLRNVDPREQSQDFKHATFILSGSVFFPEPRSSVEMEEASRPAAQVGHDESEPERRVCSTRL